MPSYHHCLAIIMCNPPLPACHLGECAYCPGISCLKDNLVTLPDENLIDTITFRQWVSVDRCTLETFVKPVDEFIDNTLNSFWHATIHIEVEKLYKNGEQHPQASPNYYSYFIHEHTFFHLLSNHHPSKLQKKAVLHYCLLYFLYYYLQV